MKKFLAFTLSIVILLVSSFSPSTIQAASLINPGFEEAGATPQEAYNWFNFHSGYSRVLFPHTGMWSIKLNGFNRNLLSGAWQRIDLNQEVEKPVFIGGYVRGTGIRTYGYFGASIYAEIHLLDGSIRYWNSLANQGTFNWQFVGFNTGHLNLGNPINYMYIVPLLGHSTGTAYFDDLVVAEQNPHESAVTIMIDDGEDTTYTIGVPELVKYGYAASATITANNVGKGGYMNSNQLRDLQNLGWEIVSHGLSHQDLTILSRGKMRRELRNSKRNLERSGLVVKNFAYPYGTYNSQIIYEASQYYRSGRPYETGVNYEGTYPFEIKVRGTVNTTTPEEVESWLTSAKANNQWLIIVFHSLTETGNDKYHTPPETFRQMIAKIADSGMNVVTYDQGIDMFGYFPIN